MTVLFVLISLLASAVGAICGIGGGIIIKPVLDSLGTMDVKTVSFLSGCTILAMSAYSVIIAIIKKESQVRWKTATPMAVGTVIGGLLGKEMFQYLISRYSQEKIGEVQAIALAALTLGTLMYTLYKKKIKTRNVSNFWVCLIIGALLGIISSFLGIGGGPINLVILFFFFSMPTKVAAQNSLYMILLSQLSSLGSSVARGIPDFDPLLLTAMTLAGIFGAIIGKKVNKHIDEKTVERLFIGLMVVIILINIYNVYRFHVG